jgi:hypothetical protein
MKRVNLKRTIPGRSDKLRLSEPDLKRLNIKVPQGLKDDMEREADGLGVTLSLYVYAILNNRSVLKMGKLFTKGR